MRVFNCLGLRLRVCLFNWWCVCLRAVLLVCFDVCPIARLCVFVCLCVCLGGWLSGCVLFVCVVVL